MDYQYMKSYHWGPMGPGPGPGPKKCRTRPSIPRPSGLPARSSPARPSCDFFWARARAHGPMGPPYDISKSMKIKKQNQKSLKYIKINKNK